jgi:cell wall assembly regulator SMI1
MVSVRKDHAVPPAPVAESWRRIEAWLDEHLPAVKSSLRPGVSKRDLNKFEKAFERPLPEDVRESWLIHDGQGQPPDEFYATAERPIPESLGLFYGVALNPLTAKRGLAPQSVLGEWAWAWEGPTVNPVTREERLLAPKPVLEWAAWATGARGKADHAIGRDSGEGHPSFPPGAVRRSHLHVGWLPLATLVDSDFLGIDLAPGPRGVVGQVITYAATATPVTFWRRVGRNSWRILPTSLRPGTSLST